jgi:hypothetical protein
MQEKNESRYLSDFQAAVHLLKGVASSQSCLATKPAANLRDSNRLQVRGRNDLSARP